VPPPPPGEAPIPGGFNLFSQFSATCFYFGASLTDQMQAVISTGGKKTHLILKNAIILPRQARDKHRESTQRKDTFLQGPRPTRRALRHCRALAVKNPDVPLLVCCAFISGFLVCCPERACLGNASMLST
jgi:hypothetical protein